MVESKENYKFYLGVKGLTLRAHIKECVCLIEVTVQAESTSYSFMFLIYTTIHYT